MGSGRGVGPWSKVVGSGRGVGPWGQVMGLGRGVGPWGQVVGQAVGSGRGFKSWVGVGSDESRMDEQMIEQTGSRVNGKKYDRRSLVLGGRNCR